MCKVRGGMFRVRERMCRVLYKLYMFLDMLCATCCKPAELLKNKAARYTDRA